MARAIGYEWDENDNLTAIGDADSYYEFTFDALREVTAEQWSVVSGQRPEKRPQLSLCTEVHINYPEG